MMRNKPFSGVAVVFTIIMGLFACVCHEFKIG